MFSAAANTIHFVHECDANERYNFIVNIWDAHCRMLFHNSYSSFKTICSLLLTTLSISISNSISIFRAIFHSDLSVSTNTWQEILFHAIFIGFSNVNIYARYFRIINNNIQKAMNAISTGSSPSLYSICLSSFFLFILGFDPHGFFPFNFFSFQPFYDNLKIW